MQRIRRKPASVIAEEEARRAARIEQLVEGIRRAIAVDPKSIAASVSDMVAQPAPARRAR